MTPALHIGLEEYLKIGATRVVNKKKNLIQDDIVRSVPSTEDAYGTTEPRGRATELSSYSMV